MLRPAIEPVTNCSWDGHLQVPGRPEALDIGLGPKVLRENVCSHSVTITWMAVRAPRPKQNSVHPYTPRSGLTTDFKTLENLHA